jgi:hypothetical protein
VKTYKTLWRKAYIPVLIIALLILAAILYGIRNGGSSNGKGGNILAGASPDTSAFQMYYFDGVSVAVRRQRKAPSPRWIFLFMGSGSAIRTAMIFP